MTTHDCPGIVLCHTHPRVNIWQGGGTGRWYVDGPNDQPHMETLDYQEALTEAHRHARDLALTAVQSQPGVTP